MSRELHTTGIVRIRGISNGAVTVLEEDAGGKIFRCKCATGLIPSATAGYAVGCELIDTTTGISYSNQGSITSCSFKSSLNSPSASPSSSPSSSPSAS